ncbi:MAG: hypothetical protein NTX79_04880 [Candidatus Micrarchaeota archaeon]|nr:hypothetical protein [Candidatus Micrarchaeota archaeon]
MEEEQNEQRMPEQQKISKEEQEAMASAGLKRVRRYGGKVYELYGLALLDDTRKCQELMELAQGFKTQGIPCRTEEKASCVAVYIRVS